MSTPKSKTPSPGLDRDNTDPQQMFSTLTGQTSAATPSLVPPRLVVEGKLLAPMLTIGIRTLRFWDATGKLPNPLRIGGRVVWLLDEIKAWLAAGAPLRAEWEAQKRADKGGRR